MPLMNSMLDLRYGCASAGRLPQGVVAVYCT